MEASLASRRSARIRRTALVRHSQGHEPHPLTHRGRAVLPHGGEVPCVARHLLLGPADLA